MYVEKTYICCEIHTKHTNAHYGKIVEFLNVKPGDITRL